MDMVNFLAVPVVDNEPVVVGNPKLINHHLDRLVQEVQNLEWSLLEIAVFDLGKEQQVDRVFGPVVRDDDDVVIFKKYPGWKFAADYPAKNARHGAEYRFGRSERNIDLRWPQPLANVERMC